MAMAEVSAVDELRNVIGESGTKLGYPNLKEKQVEAVISFIQGRDTFVSLPTSYGKSLIYAVLPYVFDKLRGETLPMVVVVGSGD